MSRYSEIIENLEKLLAAGDWGNVLASLANEVMKINSEPLAKAVVFGSPELDRLCQRAGEMAWISGVVEPLAPFSEQLVVHVATELYHKVGGHTLALKDVIRAQPDMRHVVLLTNLHDRVLEPDLVFSDLDSVQEVNVAPSGDVATKLVWLLAKLRQLRPAKLVLFQHHYDSVAIAGALPQVANEVFYFHHCDHDMALGVYLPNAFHVDCVNLSYENCRSHLGVHNQVYWPLVSPDMGGRDASHEFMRGGRLTTCSHGSFNKFIAAGRYSYFEMIQRRLSEVSGIHLHIGPLPDQMLADFHEALSSNGIDSSRFQHVPPVASLWAYLRDSDIDLCISSFPLGGGKGNVEAMGAGLPILVQQSTLARCYSSRDSVYEQAFWWQTPAQFMGVLQSVTPDLLSLHAAKARSHYEAWHHPRELEYAINNGRRTTSQPPMYPFQTDTFALHCR